MGIQVALLTLVQQRGPEEQEVPPIGSLLRFRALVLLFHTLNRGNRARPLGDLLASK